MLTYSDGRNAKDAGANGCWNGWVKSWGNPCNKFSNNIFNNLGMCISTNISKNIGINIGKVISKTVLNSHPRPLRSAGIALLLAVCGVAFAQAPASKPADASAAALLDKYASLTSQLASNAYGRPLQLDSVQTSNRVTGNAYAVLDAPFSVVSSSLKNPKRLCDVIILHINTKYCRSTLEASPSVLMVNFGKKNAQALSDTFPLEFAMTTSVATAHFLQVQLNAEKGPLGTSNYGIELAAVPLPESGGGKTFLHLRYSYGFGLAGRMAMQAYLATAGSSKVGFTQLAQPSPNGQRAYVGGMRGAVERNTMRYYLAIDAYLQAMNAPQAEQQNARLEKWFDSTEQYPVQLRETDKASYLAMKKDEIKRQQTAQPGS